MTQSANRRDFLKKGSLAAAGLLAAAGTARSQEGTAEVPSAAPSPKRAANTPPHPDHVQAEYDGFSRFRPSRGNAPDSDYYLGKLVPGFRKPADGPAPFIAPDLETLPFTMTRTASRSFTWFRSR